MLKHLVGCRVGDSMLNGDAMFRSERRRREMEVEALQVELMQLPSQTSR